MKRIMILSIAFAFGLAMAASAAAPKAATHAAAKSLTGCLEKGDEANVYKLTHTGGEDWELIGAPASLKMAEHVGHKVEVSGTAMSAASAEKAEHMAEKGEKGGSKAHEMQGEKGENHLKVTGLKHVAPTCP